MGGDEIYLVLEDASTPEGPAGTQGRLLLGTQKAAQDLTLLRQYHVKRIVCAGTPAFHRRDAGGTNGVHGAPAAAAGAFSYLEVNIKDLPSENLLGRLDECVAFVEAGVRRGETVLVNCVYAQSRSAAIAVAYLMHNKGCSVSEATDKVREAQPTVHINPGFEAQLQLYCDLGCRLPDTEAHENAPVAAEASKSNSSSAARAVATYRWFSFARTVEESGLWGWKARRVEGSRVVAVGSAYRCKACRVPLFSESNVLDHAHPLVLAAGDSVYASFSRHGDGSSWLKARDAAAAASFSTSKEAAREATGQHRPRAPGRGAQGSGRSRGASLHDERCSSCTSVFTEALDWIGIGESGGSNRDLAHNSGKITCPGEKGGVACGSKLGAWSIGGINCSCGRMVKPAIQFTSSRIERVQARQPLG